MQVSVRGGKLQTSCRMLSPMSSLDGALVSTSLWRGHLSQQVCGIFSSPIFFASLFLSVFFSFMQCILVVVYICFPF